MERELHHTERKLSTRATCHLLAAALAVAALAPGWHPEAAAPLAASAAYRRLTRDEVVTHAVRRDLLTRIEQAPGITVGALAASAALDYKTVSHHARVLADFRLVERHVDGRLNRLYPAGGLAHPLRPLQEASATATAVALLRAVASEPGVHPALLARRLGLAKSTVKWHMDRLLERGILQAEAGAGTLSLRVSPQYVAALGGPGLGSSGS
ncbi:MAG TPA: winged helix-turn-helix transcriptional regulator [Candidatus Thermoplasmatota archaeon]|nr:winged helix-turn-helix transcriptional regulator [Candidatus Thermoplasmatota archaeon]